MCIQIMTQYQSKDGQILTCNGVLVIWSFCDFPIDLFYALPKDVQKSIILTTAGT